MIDQHVVRPLQLDGDALPVEHGGDGDAGRQAESGQDCRPDRRPPAQRKKQAAARLIDPGAPMPAASGGLGLCSDHQAIDRSRFGASLQFAAGRVDRGQDLDTVAPNALAQAGADAVRGQGDRRCVHAGIIADTPGRRKRHIRTQNSIQPLCAAIVDSISDGERSGVRLFLPNMRCNPATKGPNGRLHCGKLENAMCSC